MATNISGGNQGQGQPATELYAQAQASIFASLANYGAGASRKLSLLSQDKREGNVGRAPELDQASLINQMQSIPGLKLLGDKNAPSADGPLSPACLLQKGLEGLASNCVIEPPAGRQRINTTTVLDAASIKNEPQITSPRGNLLSPTSTFGRSGGPLFRVGSDHHMWEEASQD